MKEFLQDGTSKINDVTKRIKASRKSKNTLTDDEREKGKAEILKVLKECEKEKLIINPSHKDSLRLSLIIAKYWGKDGFMYYMQFQRLKHPTNIEKKQKSYHTTFLKDCEKENISLSIGTLNYMLGQAKKAKQQLF